MLKAMVSINTADDVTDVSPSTEVLQQKTRAYYCSHCKRKVPKTTFYRHYAKFYDKFKQRWNTCTEYDESSSSSDAGSSDELESHHCNLQDPYSTSVAVPEELDAATVNETSSSSSECGLSSDTESSSSSGDPVLSDQSLNIDTCSSALESEDDDNINSTNDCQYRSTLFKLLWFLLMWQTVFHISGAAVRCILRFLKYFVKLLGVAYQNPNLISFSNSIPVTVITAEKKLGIQQENIGVIEYVVCPKCNTIYSYDNCIETRANGAHLARSCCHVKYPQHPHHSRRQPCNTDVLQTSIHKELIPIKTYSYHPLYLSIQRLVSKPGFLNDCEQWRVRQHIMPSGYLGDIYDGQIWRNVYSDFLKSPYSYLLCLNVDWFQPFKHTQYSVGAIYLTVQNLPRQERYKLENIILVGIIPGPKEPALTIDSYLHPLINELQEYKTGISVTTPHNINITIRLAIACVSCDIPATRKVCGFLSHHANLGCNKCYKDFSSKTDLFDRENWKARTGVKHRKECRKIRSKKTKSKKEQKQSKYGVRDCALLSLTYFDPIRFVAVDLMHNLLLGTAKHMFCLWIKLSLITKQHLQQFDVLIQRFVVPDNVRRLPTQIKSNYLSFKAAQWSSWTQIYSPVLLKGVLPNEHYKCWLLFVRATTILCQRIIQKTDIETADLLLEKFCKSVETLYGPTHCTINMHLHLHIKQTLLDFGPAHSTWCFSFERYNNILGSVPTNHKSVESQFMQKILKSQAITSLATNIDDEDLLHIIHKEKGDSSNYSLLQHSTSDSELINTLKLSQVELTSNYGNISTITMLEPIKEGVFNNEETVCLAELYRQLNQTHTIQYVPPFYTYTGRVNVGSDTLGSTLNYHSSQSSSVISAYWPTHGNKITAFNGSRLSFGKVMYYFNHTVTMTHSTSKALSICNYIMAKVCWMEDHPQQARFGISATVCNTSYREQSLCSFIPVARIAGKCASCELEIDRETVFVACSISLKHCV